MKKMGLLRRKLLAMTVDARQVSHVLPNDPGLGGCPGEIASSYRSLQRPIHNQKSVRIKKVQV